MPSERASAHRYNLTRHPQQGLACTVEEDVEVTRRNLLKTSALAATSYTLVGAGGGLALAQTATCPVICWPLQYGATYVPVGEVCVTNDSTNIYVTFKLTDPVNTSFGTLHLWVGSDPSLIPMNSQGVPVPGQFPHHYTTVGESEYTFVIPLTDKFIDIVIDPASCPNPLPTVRVVAHAEVRVGGSLETAFGGTTCTRVRGERGRWYCYGDYVLCCNPDEPPPQLGGCETAFAKGGYVFVTDNRFNPEGLPSLNLVKSRWGWAINVTATGTTSYDIYAGAGRNRGGTNVGTLTVEWDSVSGALKITYSISAGYLMSEVHVYAGDTKPTTVAPGRYGHIQYYPAGSAEHVYETVVLDSDGDGIWIIAHAVTCAIE